jgi:Tfp pilus assembly protein PilF
MGGTMRKFGVIFGLIGLVIATSLGITFWSAINNDHIATAEYHDRETADLQKAEQLITSDHIDEALPIIQKYRNQNLTSSPYTTKWVDLYIKANAQEHNLPELVMLFDFYPEQFKNNELAALLLANEFIFENNENAFQSVRSLFKGNETNVSAWHVLDVDALMLQGRSDDALLLLKSQKFEGKNDIPRLIRLAALTANDNPKEAWGYLTDAFNLDPTTVDLRTFRARHLENGGKPKQAQIEYVAAVNLLPSNLYLKDQLADFFIRQNDYTMAIDLLKANLSTPSLDSIWLKTVFLSKLVHPVNFNWNQEKMPPGNLDPLISYYINLKPNQFWNNTAFEEIANGKEFLNQEQSTFWLRLLQNLKDHKENEALTMLTYNPFNTTSWNPNLEKALIYTLNYRKEGKFNSKDENKVIVTEKINEGATALPRQLIEQINNLAAKAHHEKSKIAISQNLHDLLVSPEIYTALFLAANWPEAALQFNASDVTPNHLPDWFTLGLIQATYKNRGIQQAIDFAMQQKTSPVIKLQIADLYISAGQKEKAVEELKTLTTIEGNVGARAAQQLSLLYLEQKDYKKAKEVISNNSAFTQTIRGQELLGRIAVHLNDIITADRIFSSIENSSPEARSYLAKKAYSEKNWQKARELTEQLIKDYPDNKQLKENLKSIVQQEKQRR